MQKKVGIGLGLSLLIFLIVMSSGQIQVFFPQESNANTNRALAPEATGYLRQIVTSFAAWNRTNLYWVQTSPEYLCLSPHMVITNAIHASGGTTAWGDSPELTSGNWTDTYTQNSQWWLSRQDTDWRLSVLGLTFANPNSARQYYNVTVRVVCRVASQYNLNGAISTSNRTMHPNLFLANAEEYQLSNILTWVPRDNAWHAYSLELRDQTQPINQVTGQLGGFWQSSLRFELWRFQKGGISWWLDDSWLSLEAANISWSYLEYANSGVATSPIYTLGDGDHTYKQLNNITFAPPTIPNGTAFLTELTVLTPTGWTAWAPYTSGAPIAMLANKVQLRLTMTTEPALKQKTPFILTSTNTPIVINYGDPPPTPIPPIISNIQQTPPASDVGYRDAVNVSCVIETYVPLTRVILNYTMLNWFTFRLVTMTGSNQSGKALFWGMIPKHTVGVPIRYKIFAENQWQSTTENATSSEFTFTVIDNVPPNIEHANTSQWVKPLSPAPSTPDIRFECRVLDYMCNVETVNLVVTQPGFYYNQSFEMEWNASTFCTYYRDINRLITHGQIRYFIETYDERGNRNQTRFYNITIDDIPPQVMLYTSPAPVQYTDLVQLQANITDINGITAVSMRWSLNNWITNQTPKVMVHESGPTWQTEFPLPVQSWLTTVWWEILAQDGVGNWAFKYSSYKVQDYTAPELVSVDYPQPVEEGRALPVNITIREPSRASGLNPDVIFLRYVTNANPRVYTLGFTHLSGDTWGTVIPAHGVNTTVSFWIYAEDNALNNVTTEPYTFTVIEAVTLIDWVYFGLWVVILIATIAILLLVRRRSRRVTGSWFIGLGAIGLLGVTTITWISPLSWLNLGVLSFQEWLNRIGESGTWFSLIWLLFFVFVAFAFGLGLLSSYDHRWSQRVPRADASQNAWAGTEVLLEECLQDLED